MCAVTIDKKNITKKQHYVPQVYLRGFSTNNKQIWSYTLSPLDSGKYVAIESVCRENYLYELKDNDGNWLTPNWIERILSILEGMFAENLRRLEKKAFLKENYRTKSFLTTEEKTFWKLFVAVQMMRSPVVLREANTVVKELANGQLTDNQIRALAVSQCLPLFSELKPEDKNVFTVFLKPLLTMSTAIGVDENGTMFTSDDPVYCYSSQRENILQIEEYEKIVFPLTSNLVLLMFGGEMAKEYDRNRLFPLDYEAQEDIKLSIAYSAENRVFSKTKLFSSDIELIKKARKDREADDIKNRGL